MYTEQAIQKLEQEKKSVTDNKEKAMVGEVVKALCEFCRQNEEFSQAVVQGGTLADCMKAVAKGVTDALSDLEAYKRAVQFYFDGATVQFVMKIALTPEETEKEREPNRERGLLINLDEFL